MPVTKPKRGEDVRLLHRNVSELVSGVNALTNMTVTWNGRIHGVGSLSIKGDKSEIQIKAQSDDNKNAGGIVVPPTPVGLSSNLNPSISGQTVIFTATVPAGSVGTVTFYIDNVAYVTLTVPFTGVVEAPGTGTLSDGTHQIVAYYSGDGAHAPGFGFLTQTVGAKIDPPMGLLVAPNPAGFHTAIEFRVDLPPDATGEVQFLLDGFSLGSAPVIGGIGILLTTSSLFTPGTHAPAAVYGGDEKYLTKTAAGFPLVISALPGVRVDIISSNNPAATSEAITWAAEIYPAPATPTVFPTGTVQFYIEGQTWGPPAVVVPQPANGYSIAISQTTPAPNALSVGENDVSGEYSGDTNYYPSTGDITQIVLVVTEISVDCADDEPIVGVLTHLICHAPPVDNFASPTGVVDFLVDGGIVDENVGLHPSNDPPAGNTSAESSYFTFNSGGPALIRAEYEGDGTYAAVYEEHNITVFDLATQFGFNWTGYIVGNGFETVAVAWFFDLWNPEDERSTPVRIEVLEAVWNYNPTPILTGGYPVQTSFNQEFWTPRPPDDPQREIAEIFMTATGSGGIVGTNIQALLEVQFASDGHLGGIFGTGSSTLWTPYDPYHVILSVAFINLPHL